MQTSKNALTDVMMSLSALRITWLLHPDGVIRQPTCESTRQLENSPAIGFSGSGRCCVHCRRFPTTQIRSCPQWLLLTPRINFDGNRYSVPGPVSARPAGNRSCNPR